MGRNLAYASIYQADMFYARRANPFFIVLQHKTAHKLEMLVTECICLIYLPGTHDYDMACMNERGPNLNPICFKIFWFFSFVTSCIVHIAHHIQVFTCGLCVFHHWKAVYLSVGIYLRPTHTNLGGKPLTDLISENSLPLRSLWQDMFPNTLNFKGK